MRGSMSWGRIHQYVHGHCGSSLTSLIGQADIFQLRQRECVSLPQTISPRETGGNWDIIYTLPNPITRIKSLIYKMSVNNLVSIKPIGWGYGGERHTDRHAIYHLSTARVLLVYYDQTNYRGLWCPRNAFWLEGEIHPCKIVSVQSNQSREGPGKNPYIIHQ